MKFAIMKAIVAAATIFGLFSSTSLSATDAPEAVTSTTIEATDIGTGDESVYSPQDIIGPDEYYATNVVSWIETELLDYGYMETNHIIG